jgi:hypothetical protein
MIHVPVEAVRNIRCAVVQINNDMFLTEADIKT